MSFYIQSNNRNEIYIFYHAYYSSPGVLPNIAPAGLLLTPAVRSYFVFLLQRVTPPKDFPEGGRGKMSFLYYARPWVAI
jgi:hypothetical protein